MKSDKQLRKELIKFHQTSPCFLIPGDVFPNLVEQNQGIQEKEIYTVKVSYNGFTWELAKLECTTKPYGYVHNEMPVRQCAQHLYDLSIYDSVKNVTHSFSGVKLEDVKFLGGAVLFYG